MQQARVVSPTALPMQQLARTSLAVDVVVLQHVDLVDTRSVSILVDLEVVLATHFDALTALNLAATLLCLACKGDSAWWSVTSSCRSSIQLQVT